MRETKVVTSLAIFLFVFSLFVPVGGEFHQNLSNNRTDVYLLSENAPINSTFLDAFQNGLDVAVYDEDQALDSLMLVSVEVYPNYTASNDRYSQIYITDLEGQVLAGILADAGQPKFINSTTVMLPENNVTFWNIETNKTEATWFPTGHHDREYNPFTDSVMVIERVDFGEFPDETEYANMTILGDDIVEYDRDGNEVWRWEGNLTFPFDQEEFFLRNESRRGDIDWMHSNSLYWDIENGELYMNVRHLDCVVKVDYETGDTDWVVGRYIGEASGFDLRNIHGEETDSLFYHAHACEVMGPNRFVIFDNDLYNLTRDNYEIGISRYVEFEVDEDAGTATETFVWTAPSNYYHSAQGNADTLPNGNVVGSFNLRPEPIFTEVNREGEIVWEWRLNLTELDEGFNAPPNGFRRFFTEPRIELKDTIFVVEEGATLNLTFSVWDVFKRGYASDAAVRVLEDNAEITSLDFELLPFWQETIVTVELPAATGVIGEHELTIEVENADGVLSTTTIIVSITNNLPLYAAIAGGIIIIVVVVIIFIKKK